MDTLMEKGGGTHQGIKLLLKDDLLGPGFMRVTTALPDDNALFVKTLRELL